MAPKKRKPDESTQTVRDVVSCVRGISHTEAARVIKVQKQGKAAAHRDASRYPEAYPLLSSIAVQEAGTNQMLELPVLRLDKALLARCWQLPGLADVLAHHMRQKAVEGLDGILYVDEAVLGNVLRPDQNRKGYLAHFSWTALGQGLAQDSSWITVAFVRHKTIDRISGGLASYMHALALFIEECVVGVALEDSANVPYLLRARKIYLLGDEAALKATAGSKGASGMRPCLKCQNAVSKQHRQAVSLVCIDEPDISKFLPMQQKRLDAIMQHLRAASSISEYEKDCKLLGWYLIPKSLSSCPGTLVNVIDSVYDPMHCFWSNGIVNVEIGLFLERAAAQGLQKAMLQSLAALAWKCGTKGSAKEVLDERLLLFGADYRGSATQVALRARAQAEYRPDGPTTVGAKAWGHRPALKRFSGEIGDFDLSAFRAAEVQGYRPYEPDEFSEAESQDSQESLSGYVQSRWDDTKAERRYAYGTDACVKFSGVRRMEWNRPEWKDGLLKTNHLGARTPVEKMKAAVFKVMAMNRVYKGISAPPAEWQFEVERQKAGRLAEEARLIKAEKERVKKESLDEQNAGAASGHSCWLHSGAVEARANARGERQAVIEKQLMQQNTQAQSLVEDMEEALLKVPELQPPGVPGLHPQELFEARLVLRDLATSGLGQKVSELGGAPTIPKHVRREPPPPRKVQNWNQDTLSSWFNEVLCKQCVVFCPLCRAALVDAFQFAKEG
eukprot:s1502_g18.t1